MPAPVSLCWAEAPGSCMLFGEHAVLRGYPAVVCALKPRLRVSTQKRSDGRLVVDAMGKTREVDWDKRGSLAIDFRFLEACISSFGEKASCGLDIRVESCLESNKGFGSSAAVIAASLVSIGLCLGEVEPPSQADAVASERMKEKIFDKGLTILRQVQGFGSGADLAASVYGSCLEYSYSKRPRIIEEPKAFYLVYSGRKTPTSEVLRQLHEKEQSGKLDLLAIDELGKVSMAAIAFWSSIHDRNLCKHLCQRHQEAMRRLELFDDGLEKICQQLSSQDAMHKISGSGLGDCVLSFDKPVFEDQSVSQVTPDRLGLSYGVL